MKRIPLTQGKFALVDDEDYERVMQHKWCVHQRGDTYCAARNIRLPDGRKRLELLHWFILGIKGVDHRDGNAWNNQRYNLRAATKMQNNRASRRKIPGATSKFRGVSWSNDRKKWVAQITINYYHKPLGRFDSEELAARAYDYAARDAFGEFATPNFPA